MPHHLSSKELTMLKPLLLAALAAVSFSAQAAESLLARINNHGTIVVGTDGAYPPFNFTTRAASSPVTTSKSPAPSPKNSA